MCHVPECALCRHKVDLPIAPELYEVIPDPPSDGNPSYEQRLWDEYAGRASEADIEAHREFDQVKYAQTREEARFAFADAMMAERAKRMKGETK